MLRGCLMLLMLGYAVVPPGFCFCRLSAIVLADAGPHDDDHDDDCGCPRIQRDGLLPSPSVLPTNVVIAPHVIDAIGIGDSAFLGREPIDHGCEPSHCPIYLTLRTLMI